MTIHPEPEPALTPVRQRRLMGEAYLSTGASLALALPTLGTALLSGRVLDSAFAFCALTIALLAIGHTRGQVGIRDEIGYDYEGPELAAELASRSSMFTVICISLALLL